MLNPPSDTCQALARNLAALNERQIRALYWHTQCQVMRAPQAQFHGWIRAIRDTFEAEPGDRPR